jgi:hypothetical protein
MDTLTSMKVFRQIVDSGSFVAAAETIVDKLVPMEAGGEFRKLAQRR